MAKIVLQGMAFHAYIGVYEQEQLSGNDFLVDVELYSPAIRSENDDLSRTIDYGKVYALVATVMQGRYSLIETAAAAIAEAIRTADLPLDGFLVRVAKLHPPLGGITDRVYVEVQG